MFDFNLAGLALSGMPDMFSISSFCNTTDIGVPLIFELTQSYPAAKSVSNSLLRSQVTSIPYKVCSKFLKRRLESFSLTGNM